ncbi:MAG: zinc-binding dehydrogenase [Muricoprocola sp.]
MKALVIWEDGHASLENVKEPEINEYQALVRMTAGALCGTDKEIIYNKLKGFHNYPTILGHEGIGYVEKIGSKVKNFSVGDKVVLPFLDDTEEFYSTWGAFAEYAVIGDSKAMIEDGHKIGDGVLTEGNLGQLKIPKDFDDVEASMITTYREVYSTMKRLGFQKGKSLVIYGAGPVGRVFITLAKYLGLSPIICVDHTEKKLEAARKCGADETLNFDQCDISEEVLKILPDKADIILDAAGVPALINQNLKLVKNFGDVCIYGETAKNEWLINWQDAPFCFNLRFAQWPSKAEEAAVHDEIIELMKQGVLKSMNYISDVFDFKDSVEAIEYFKNKKNTGKIAIRF